MDFNELLKTKKVLICCGSGGVGKTTLAAALGVKAAELGLRVLVLTIDPARRLAQRPQAWEAAVRYNQCAGTRRQVVDHNR